MVEELVTKLHHPIIKTTQARPLNQWKGEELTRIPTGFSQLDRALGGGLVKGQVVLIAGEPGIGKSTLLLQVSAFFSRFYGKVLYVSGEESGYQIALRGNRLGVDAEGLLILPETNLEVIMESIKDTEPYLVVVDSIQTVYSEKLESSAGSVSQVRECAHTLSTFCKSLNIPLFIVGQITKEGSIAGPKVLEHIVDTVLQFEGEMFNFYRVVKVVKNRFGSTGEVAVFRMSDNGLEEVLEPSAFFLQERVKAPGSVVFPYTEGSKPILL